MTDVPMPLYPKINGVFKRYREGAEKGRFMDWVWSVPEFRYLADNVWVWKEKIDGTNIRLGWTPDYGTHHYDGDGVRRLNVGGRSNKADIPKPLLARLVELMETMPLAEVFSKPTTLYGEGYGPGIQKGGGYRSDPDFILFDVRVHDTWLGPEEVQGIASALGIDSVPILVKATLTEAIGLIKHGFLDSSWDNHELEGIVGRPDVMLRNQWGEVITTKVKTVDFQ